MDMARRTVVPVLAAISFSHLLNDTIQSLLPAIYPILKSSYRLSFTQVGLLTLTLMVTASVLQPVVGLGNGVADEAIGIGQRRQRKQFHSGRREPAGRNGVARKQRASG